MEEQGEQEQRARKGRAEPAELVPLTPLAHQVRPLKQLRRWHCSWRGSRFEGICLFACPCWCRLRRLSSKGRDAISISMKAPTAARLSLSSSMEIGDTKDSEAIDFEPRTLNWRSERNWLSNSSRLDAGR